MVQEVVREKQIHAELPSELRRRLWQALAWKEQSFRAWLTERVAAFVEEAEAEQAREKETRKHATTP